MRFNLGLTLLETVIATAILAVVFALTMQSLASMQTFFESENVRDNLEDEARKAIYSFIDNLGSSAWEVPGIDNPSLRTDLIESLIGQKPDGSTPRWRDRQLRYYPFVVVQTSSDFGDAFGHWRRAADALPILTWADAATPPGHALPGQEIIFLKIARTAPVDNPNQIGANYINMNANSGAAVAMNNIAGGPRLNQLGFVGQSQINASVVFEENTAGALREYSYVVVADPSSGHNQLQLHYCHLGSTGVSGPFLSQVVAEHVDRLVVDTSRTSAGLSSDQVRIKVFLSQEDRRGLRHYHESGITIALRSTVDPAFSADIDNNLGAPGSFPVQY